MIALYVLNIIVIIAAIVAMTMQFFVIKAQKEITEMNGIVLGLNNFFTKRKLIVREPDCSLRGVSIHTAICNHEPIIVIDLFDDKKKKENDTEI